MNTSFKLEIVNYCNTIWNSALNISNKTYILTENDGTYIIPSFAAFACDYLIISYKILSDNQKISKYLNLSQSDHYLGNSTLKLYSADQTLRGTYQIQIQCYNNYTKAVVLTILNLKINDRCDFNNFTTF